MTRAAAVVLAAGAGRRLGTVAKALLALDDGRTFLGAIQDSAGAAGVAHVVVVVGPPHHHATEREARRLGLEIAYNPDPGRGMASSVEIGVARVQERFSGHAALLLWPVDHPRVEPATVAAVVARTPHEGAAIPVHRGRGGHPSGFGSAVWPALAACRAVDQGARGVIRALEHQGRVVRFEVADPGVIADIDTPDDLARGSG
jgi:CTP:molybdopterin cytidylyltransferase MocA